jgi:hypothetical protein
MKISVLIHRNPETGLLSAYVVQEFQGRNKEKRVLKGDNLLKGRQFSKVDSAIQRCDDVLLKLFKLLEPPEIEYVVEGETK